MKKKQPETDLKNIGGGFYKQLERDQLSIIYISHQYNEALHQNHAILFIETPNTKYQILTPICQNRVEWCLGTHD